MKTIQKFKVGNALILLDDIEKNSIDLTFTSPPYNIGVDYEVYKDNLPYDEYLLDMQEIIKKLFITTKEHGRLCFNVLMNLKIEESFKYPFIDFINIMQECGFETQGTPLWYDNTHSKHTAWGSWLSASAPYFYNPHEVLILASKGKWKREKGIDTVSKEQFITMNKGMIDFPTERNTSHPAPFSLKMAKTVIECLTFKYDTVLDPFCGSATTLKACYETERNGIGFDLNSKYYENAIDEAPYINNIDTEDKMDIFV